VAILDEARTHLEKALEINPEFARARHALATLHHKQGHLPKAIRLLRETIDARPTLSDARLLLAEVLLEDDREDEAIEQLENAADIDHNDYLARRRLAIILAAREETKKAADLFTRVVELDPLDGESHLQLAILLEHPDDFQRAILLFQIAGDLMPEDSRPPYRMALLLLRGEHTDEEGNLITTPDLEAARKHFLTAIRLDPVHGLAHLGLGRILCGDGDTRSARRHFKQATKDKRSTGYANLELARLEIEAGKNASARRFLDEAIDHPVSYRDALCERADFFVRNDNPTEAERDLKEAAKAFADAERKLLKASDNASSKTNFARARRLHEDAIDARRSQGPVWWHLGQIRASAGKSGAAIKFFKKALAADPGLYDARFDMATLLEKTGKDEEAGFHLEAVIEANWSHAEAHFRIGERALAANELEKAEMHFLIVTDIVPSHHQAKKRLRKLSGE